MPSNPIAMAAPVRAPAAAAAHPTRSDHMVAATSSTDNAIWTLWWSIRPGMKCWNAGRPTAVRRRASGTAARPAMRHAIAQAPAMAGMSHSIGQIVRTRRSANAASVNRLNTSSRPAMPASINRDQ